MNLKLKMALLGLAAGALAFQFGSCAAFLGDLLGDAVWLRGID
jgi:hypothetical protein